MNEQEAISKISEQKLSLIKEQIAICFPEIANTPDDIEKVNYLLAKGVKVTHVVPPQGEGYYIITQGGKVLRRFTIQLKF